MIKEIKLNRLFNNFCNTLVLKTYWNNPSYELFEMSVLSLHPNEKQCYLYSYYFNSYLCDLGCSFLSDVKMTELFSKRFVLHDYDIRIR